MAFVLTLFLGLVYYFLILILVVLAILALIKYIKTH